MEPERSMFAQQSQRGTHHTRSVSNGSCQMASIIHPQKFQTVHSVHPVSPLLHININHVNCKCASRRVDTEACSQIDAGDTRQQGAASLPRSQRCCFGKAGKGAQAFAAEGKAYLHFLSDVLVPPSLVSVLPNFVSIFDWD